MLEDLGKIQNPFVRSLTAAITVGSIVTMAGAIALGIANAKDNAAYRAAVSSTVAGTGCGAIFGLLYTRKRQSIAQSEQLISTQSVDAPVWKNWRDFVVVRKVKESEEITSFYLKPGDHKPIPSFQPGQFLTIKLNIPGQASPVVRTYSLSDYTEPCEYYRLSIKREPMPAGSTFMPGIVSNFMHDQVQEGFVIAAKPPSGRFVLDVHKQIPAVLISNGVGITPMISMIKAVALLNPDRQIWFVHGAKNGRFHAFRNEVTAIARQYPNLHVHFVYSRPEAEDAGCYQSTGYVDAELIQLLVEQDAEYFLCGSPPFMQSLREGLKAAGISENRVFYEAFTRGTSKSSEALTLSHNAVHSSEQGAALRQAEVVFAGSNKTATWTPDEGSLLEFAEANNLEPAYSCRQGICGTCRCQILEGDVEYQETPIAPTDGGVLICISQPKTSRVVLDL